MCIGETKGHNQILELTQRGIEGVPFIPLTNPHQVVGISRAQLEEDEGFPVQAQMQS